MMFGRRVAQFQADHSNPSALLYPGIVADNPPLGGPPFCVFYLSFSLLSSFPLLVTSTSISRAFSNLSDFSLQSFVSLQVLLSSIICALLVNKLNGPLVIDHLSKQLLSSIVHQITTPHLHQQP